MREDRRRLLDILEAIERIEKYAVRGRSAFVNDELLQNWILRHLQIIGEAVRALPDDFQARYPEIPWSEIIGMRTILVHRYFDIDTNVVWVVVDRDLPILKDRVAALLQESRAREE